MNTNTFSSRVISLLLLLLTVVHAHPALSFSISPVVTNDVETPVTLSIGPLHPDDSVLEARTVLELPGKRGPKPFDNFTHEVHITNESDFVIRPTYSLPTKTYILSYSVLLNTTNEQGERVTEWIDSSGVEVQVVDRPVNIISFIAGTIVIVAVSTSFAYLFMRASTPDFLAGIIPAFLHPYVPALNANASKK